ncbi:MAG: hypothetical protein CBE00_06385 [Planctomycetaceae bacterium TMED240]|nr:hypothetical protein [Rhodopirellula sp.]OUX06883.1 MAG: hypothetical protein CBE00_06385 [Planctomycetaceae bacterium TMED240]
MNMVIAKAASTYERSRKPSFVSPESLHPAFPQAAPHDEIQVEDVQTVADLMTAICEDCNQNSLLYVLRSDTGHDGE